MDNSNTKNKNKGIIVINFKAYEEATGKKALRLAKICDEVSKETKAYIAIAVQATDIRMIAEKVKIPVFSQHIDKVSYGANTGHITAGSVREAGAKGTLINHSEKQIKDIKETIEKARKAGLKTIVCANDVKKGIEVSRYSPDYIAIEPPELIGGPISVSSARPELISGSVKKIKGNVLVGAGINSEEDVRTAIRLGAKGVLLASAFVKSKRPKEFLRSIVKALG